VADREVPLVSDTQSRGELGCRRSHRRQDLRGNRGHLLVPHIKANLLTNLAHALLDSKVLAVENGGPSRGCGRVRVKQGEAVGRRITARGELERSGHVVSDLCEIRRGGVRDEVGNVTSLVLG